MTVSSVLLLALLVSIAALIFHYLRLLRPYSKLPTSFAILLDSIELCICSAAKRGYAHKNLLQKMEEMCSKYKKEGLFATWLTQPMVFVFDQEFVKKILNEPSAIYRPKVYSPLDIFLANSIFRSNGEKWKRQKKIVQQAFQFALKGNKIQIVNKCSGNLVKTLSSIPDNTTNEMMDILRHSGIQIIFESLFGIEVDFADRSLIVKTLHRLSTITVERLFTPWLYPDFSFHIFSEGRKCLKLYKTSYGMILEMFGNLKENMLTSKNNLFDRKLGLVGEVLLKKHLEDPSFTMDELMEHTLFLIIAAFDTTAITLMWCLHLLGLHENVQERILLEVENFEADLSAEDLRKMVYTECVIQETLRMYTTVPVMFRYLAKDLQCGKYTIPKGSTVVLPLYVLHKNSDIFPDPEKFDPERFMKTKNGDSRQLYTAPFSEGLRPCLGKVDALNQLKIMIAYVVRNFKVISLDKPKDVEVSYNVLIEAAVPLRMQFIPRRVINDGEVSSRSKS